MKTKRQQSDSTAAAGLGFVDPRLVKLLRQEGVKTDRLDGQTLLMDAVPLAAEFSKPRSNVLIKQMRYGAGANTFVDEDLAYQGDAARLTALLGGPVHKGWRKLRCFPPRSPTPSRAKRDGSVRTTPSP
jgi:hypothetical protein